MKIQARFSKGDVVYSAYTEYSANWVSCPDCLGTLKWAVVFADGEMVEVPCQTCKRGYEPPTGKIDTQMWKPVVRKVTIGAIRYDGERKEEEQFSYMCEETGVGSGRVYYDKDLYKIEMDAIIRSKQKMEEQMQHIAQNNFSKKFGGTKRIEDALSSWGFSRKCQIEEAQKFRQWAKISGIGKKNL